MTSPAPCLKCSGTGIITKFGHIEHGKCFGCMGTGRRMTAKDRAAIIQARLDRREARDAAQQGVSVETLRLFLTPGAGVPKHPSGCSFSLQEFHAWRAQEVAA